MNNITPKCLHKRVDHNLECLDCDEPIWADEKATTDDEELKTVINNHWDYLKIRQRLSDLSGVPCMAISTVSHMEKIAEKLRLKDQKILQLEDKIKAIKEELS